MTATPKPVVLAEANPCQGSVTNAMLDAPAAATTSPTSTVRRAPMRSMRTPLIGFPASDANGPAATIMPATPRSIPRTRWRYTIRNGSERPVPIADRRSPVSTSHAGRGRSGTRPASLGAMAEIVPHRGPVRQLRVALTVEDYAQALRFYRDALGLPVEHEWEEAEGSGAIFDAG